jgi:hypothetical protein
MFMANLLQEGKARIHGFGKHVSNAQSEQPHFFSPDTFDLDSLLQQCLDGTILWSTPSLNNTVAQTQQIENKQPGDKSLSDEPAEPPVAAPRHPEFEIPLAN